MEIATGDVASGRGVIVSGRSRESVDALARGLSEWLESCGLGAGVRLHPIVDETGVRVCAQLVEEARRAWLPAFDTLGLAERLGLHPFAHEHDMCAEILLAMLGAPVAYTFPDLDELKSAVSIRRLTAEVAKRTHIAFETAAAERPEEDWIADENGFRLRAGRDLITALRRALKPEFSNGRVSSFSCYRATEYIAILGLAKELAVHHRKLFDDLSLQWEHKPIASGRFHDVFLREYGSIEQPMPARHYVPGERVWFRNPDPVSSDASGFEGSWVFYLGGGRFANFWHRDQPFTLESKCLEIYHWRHATYSDDEGELRIDEAKALAHVEASHQDPEAMQEILRQMMRLRDPRGVYAQGGCIDASREHTRWVRPGTSDIVLPGIH